MLSGSNGRACGVRTSKPTFSESSSRLAHSSIPLAICTGGVGGYLVRSAPLRLGFGGQGQPKPARPAQQPIEYGRAEYRRQPRAYAYCHSARSPLLISCYFTCPTSAAISSAVIPFGTLME